MSKRRGDPADSGNVLPLSAPVNTMDQVHLVEAAQAGDLHAMSALLDQLTVPVGRICAAIALADGPDAAQEALIQIFSDLESLREPAKVRAWAGRIATREAIRHAKKGRRPPPKCAQDPDPPPPLAEIQDVRAADRKFKLRFPWVR